MPSCQVAHPSVVIIDQPPVPKPTQASETRKPFQFMVTERYRKPWTSASGCCWCLKLPFKRSMIHQPRDDFNFRSIFHHPDKQSFSCIKFCLFLYFMQQAMHQSILSASVQALSSIRSEKVFSRLPAKDFLY
jgi:transposase